MNRIYDIKIGMSNAESSENIPGKGVFEKITAIKNGFIVCWLDQKILFGRIVDSRPVFQSGEELSSLTNYIMKLRAFNEDAEIYLWRAQQGGFSFRLRNDGVGNPGEYIDAAQLLLGTRSEDLRDGFVRIKEDRGTDFVLPSELLSGHHLDERKNRLVLHTRNYIGQNSIGQVGYVDSRFMRIEMSGGSHGQR
jgi:CRISPR-associated protein (TIGR03984 family)